MINQFSLVIVKYNFDYIIILGLNITETERYKTGISH